MLRAFIGHFFLQEDSTGYMPSIDTNKPHCHVRLNRTMPSMLWPCLSVYALLQSEEGNEVMNLFPFSPPDLSPRLR